MTFRCGNCGKFYRYEDLLNAFENKIKFIRCRACNVVGDLSHWQGMWSESGIKQGYSRLATAEFEKAFDYFQQALQEDPSPDALFGAALVEFKVQVQVGGVESGSRFPKLTCHQYCRDSFRNHEYIRRAREYYLQDEESKNCYREDLDKLERYSEIIDGRMRRYGELQSELPGGYDVFIAYEDDHIGDGDRGLEIAMDVKNRLDTNIAENTFLPIMPAATQDPEETFDLINRYEAEIMYAIGHAKYMIVIDDGTVNARLKSIYSRFDDRNGAQRIFCLQYGGRASGGLRDRGVKYYDYSDLDELAKTINGLINGLGGDFLRRRYTVTYADARGTHTIEVQNGQKFDLPLPLPVIRGGAFLGLFDAKTGGKQYVDQNGHSVEPYSLRENITLYPQFSFGTSQKSDDVLTFIEGGKRAEFGSYPQSLADKEIADRICGQVSSYPTRDDAAGWTPLFRTKSEVAYTWFRDQEFEGKKYRLVYFARTRALNEINSGFGDRMLQYNQGFKARNIYCFAFEPIVWEVGARERCTVVLTSTQALDSRPYQDASRSSPPALFKWLNGDFADTAFGEKEYDLLLTAEDFQVRLASEDSAKNYGTRLRYVSGTDYMRCIGGECNNHDVVSYWVDSDGRIGDYVRVAKPSGNGFAQEHAGSTYVGVVPSVIVNEISSK